VDAPWFAQSGRGTDRTWIAELRAIGGGKLLALSEEIPPSAGYPPRIDWDSIMSIARAIFEAFVAASRSYCSSAAQNAWMESSRDTCWLLSPPALRRGNRSYLWLLVVPKGWERERGVLTTPLSEMSPGRHERLRPHAPEHERKTQSRQKAAAQSIGEIIKRHVQL